MYFDFRVIMLRAIPLHIAVAHKATPLVVLLTDSKAIEVYENALKDTMVYCYAEDYCRVRLASIALCVKV